MPMEVVLLRATQEALTNVRRHRWCGPGCAACWRLAPSVAARLVRNARRPGPTPALFAREIEVLRLVGRGLTNADIGRELFIGEATVKTHLLRMFHKLGVSDRTAAVTTAMARGYL